MFRSAKAEPWLLDGVIHDLEPVAKIYLNISLSLFALKETGIKKNEFTYQMNNQVAF